MVFLNEALRKELTTIGAQLSPRIGLKPLQPLSLLKRHLVPQLVHLLVTRIPVTRIPVTRIPVTRIPVTRIPVTRIPVTRIPVTRLVYRLAHRKNSIDFTSV
jgi:hypothetical protein